MGLTQCNKENTQDPNNNNIFSAVTDPNYLLDTLTVSVKQTDEIRYGYIFSYDNLNRVSSIKFYEYFYNTPVNNNGTWTFNYPGNSTSPESMDMVSFNNYRIYFFYNADGSKNRDSIVSTANSSLRAVRKYDYDAAFSYAVARHYKNGNLKPSLEDSAIFTNYNCNGIFSKEITWYVSIPYTYEWFDNYYPTVDSRPNPFSKMNIFPAMFLTPYLNMGNQVNGNTWKGSIVSDFAFQNNPRKWKFQDHAIGGYDYIHLSNAEGEIYDSKNRIIRKNFADSLGDSHSMNFADRFYATYKYK
jgi:hypothetical protein